MTKLKKIKISKNKKVSIYVCLNMFLILHWISNNNTCALTQLENYYYNGNSNTYNKGFINRLINPIYDIKSYEIKFITVSLLLYTIYKYLSIIDFEYK